MTTTERDTGMTKEPRDPRARVSPELEAELRARRERLERRSDSDQERPIAAVVIVARRGAAHLGFPIDQVNGFRSTIVTPLPGLPATIVGLFQVRGSLHCCMDLLPMLTNERTSVGPEAILVGVLDTPRGPLGVCFDEVIGPRVIYQDEIDHGVRSSRQTFVLLVTRDLLEVIDARRLCESPHVLITAS